MACPAGVERALHATSTLVHDVRVDHRRFHAIVPEQFLHCPDVVTAFHLDPVDVSLFRPVAVVPPADGVFVLGPIAWGAWVERPAFLVWP